MFQREDWKTSDKTFQKFFLFAAKLSSATQKDLRNIFIKRDLLLLRL
jgi:hypothetical protein